MHSSNLYATDGLLILGVVLVCITVYTGLRGLYGRSAALPMEEDMAGEHVPAPRSRCPAADLPKTRRAA